MHRRGDGLKGLPDAIEVTWPRAVVQTCVLHLIRGTSVTPAVSTGMPWRGTCAAIYTAVNEADAKEQMMEFFDKWAERYPAVRQLWENAR